MRVFLWILTLVGAIAATLSIAETMLMSVSAPQQAAGAGLGVAFVVIPYCAARAVESLKR